MVTAFKTVYDFLKEVPKNMNHEEMYLEMVRKNQIYKEPNPINLAEWELSALGYAENNILCGMNIPNKFTLNNMYKKLPLSVFAIAKQRDDPNSLTSKKQKTTYIKTFETKNVIEFNALEGRAQYPGRPGICFERDRVLRGQIQAACPNMSAKHVNDIITVRVGEKLNIDTDMRHVFAKGYLLLCDYTLATASKHHERKITPSMDIPAISNCSSLDRIKAISAYDIVLDAAVFTPSERALLSVMCSAHPTVQYAENNVYNMIDMAEDNFIWISKSQFTMPEGFSFGSPDRMYWDMIQIACKLGCLHDMRTAFKEMRGVVFLAHKISELTGAYDFPMLYPKSHCLRAALGERNNWQDFVQVQSNYFSTTKAIIVDMLLGEALAYSAFAMSEELGAYGKVGCPTGSVNQDPVFNSNCRDYGLKHEQEEVNMLLQEWRGLKNCRMPIGFRGFLKNFVMMIANNINGGIMQVKDIAIPQIGFEIPYSNCKNTSWALVKGYQPDLRKHVFGYQEVEENLRGQAFKFMMGVRQKVPLVGLNSIGVRQNDVLSHDEMEFDMGAGGTYTITQMSYGLACEITGRVDEMEESAMALHRTRFSGTRCSVVCDPVGDEYIVSNTELPATSTTHGFKKEEGGDTSADEIDKIMTPGGSEIRVQRDEELWKKLKSRVGSLGRKKALSIGGRRAKYDVDKTGRFVVNPNASDEFKYLQEPFNDDVKQGTYQILRQPTSGEGLLCGLRASVQDLVNHGYIPSDKADRFIQEHADEIGRMGNYQTTELARLWNEMGFGLTVITPNSDGGTRAINFGTRGSEHNIVLYNNGTHYENVVFGPGENINVTNYEEGTTAEVQLERLEALRQWIGRD